jgi:DNA-binding LytR/AlgR family response regulator
MKVLIVEDEKHAAKRIVRLLENISTSISIAGFTETVEETINWLQCSPSPDLILMDIQLDDGICFEIFETIKVDIPVIFTTAYDQYAIKAFKVNSVDYLLKPIEEDALRQAIEKFKTIHTRSNIDQIDFKRIFKEVSNQYKNRFLVKIGPRFKSIPVNEISYFHISERSVLIKCFNGRDYGVEYSLEQLQKIVDPEKFFRINRNCLINIDAISEMLSYSTSRLQLKLKSDETGDNFVVSRDKVADFKKWVDK